jgi:hypothetical protein
MIRRIALVGIIATALPALLLVAPPANAGPVVGCLGPTCSVSLSSLITLRGDYTEGVGSAQVPVDIPPPPCLWEPIGNTATGAAYIIGEFGYVKPGAGDQFGIAASVQQAKKQLKDGGPAGTWYMLPVNPAASAAGKAACLLLPLFYFVQPGQALPVPPIPTKTLAAFAYNHMLIPKPTLTINPARRGYVNLATYVWANWAAEGGTVIQRANPNGTYNVTATLGDESATVWAQPATSGFTVTPSAQGTSYSAGCGIDGSRSPVGKPPPSSGPGVAPDCGVLWQSPTNGATITATVTFNVTWGAGNLDGPGPNGLPQIPIVSRATTVPIAEIQGLNG